MEYWKTWKDLGRNPPWALPMHIWTKYPRNSSNTSVMIVFGMRSKSMSWEVVLLTAGCSLCRGREREWPKQRLERNRTYGVTNYYPRLSNNKSRKVCNIHQSYFTTVSLWAWNIQTEPKSGLERNITIWTKWSLFSHQHCHTWCSNIRTYNRRIKSN